MSAQQEILMSVDTLLVSLIALVCLLAVSFYGGALGHNISTSASQIR